MSVAGRSINRGRKEINLQSFGLLVRIGQGCLPDKGGEGTTPGDIRSENADMSNEKSCEKPPASMSKLRSVNLRRVNRGP